MSQSSQPARRADPHTPGRRAPRLRACAAVLALAAFPGAALALLPGDSNGQSLASIQGRLGAARGKLDHLRGRQQVLTGDISALSTRIRSLEREIGDLRQREGKVANTLAAKRAELVRVRARYEEEHARYIRLQGQLKRAQGVLATRLVAIYEADEPDFVTVVLQADGFDDMLVRAEYLRRIGEQDSTIVDRVRELEQASAQKKALLGDLKQQAQNAVGTIEAQQRELAATRAGIVDRQGQLVAARTDKRGALVSTRAKATDVEGDITALEAASAQVTSQLRSAGPLPAGPVRHGASGFIWPVNGPVVSPFGMRWGRLHAGVDIAVPSGTPIRAAASGRVAIAGWVGGYGNYTCIQHSGVIATCYGHQSSIGVSVGTSVTQGQVIGSSGCTGHCLGPHVHFEVRINGTPVDPMGYL
jgi:murein DD-endopeptidase MepM/ murein hydrolase activator NlpD